MSRVGKKPIPTPAGVTVAIQGQAVNLKGPKGALSFQAPDEVAVRHEGGALVVTPRRDDQRARALWGMVRAILANNVEGVTNGFTRTLELTGVGYRAAMQGKNLQMQLGYSHDVVYAPPAGVTITTPKPTEIRIEGIDAQVVGQVAAEIRGNRPPEPYKGKGIRHAGEYIRRKEGKKK
jgi:large subunit ribosomal protein L6